MQSTNNASRSAHVAEESVADCPFSMAQEYASEYLRAAEKHGPESAIGLPALRRDVSLTFGLRSDIADDGRAHDEIRLRWRSGVMLLPDFHGTIRFRIDGARTAVLVEGSYAPPFGAFGRLFDRIVGRAIARGSVHDLATRLAAHLSRREATWRACHVAVTEATDAVS
jgi:hypothetical protein